MKMKELDGRLFLACRRLDIEGVIRLLEQGADPNLCTAGLMDRSLLSHVIYYGTYSEYREKKLREQEAKITCVVRLLLEHGADPNKIHVDDGGTSIFTPIYYAVKFCGDPVCTQLLLDAGADVNLPHDDSSFPLYDMLEEDWDFFDPVMMSNEKDPETARRKKGAWFFLFSEILLEHSARTYDMLHPAYVWEKLSEKEQEFLCACGELDLDSVRHLLQEDPALIGISDKRGHHYAFYAADWASHTRRSSFRGNRTGFEDEVIEVMRFLVRHDPAPETGLVEAALCAADKGYPLVLEWCIGKLRKYGKDSFQKNGRIIFNDWNNNGRYLFTDGINSRIFSAFGKIALKSCGEQGIVIHRRSSCARIEDL